MQFCVSCAATILEGKTCNHSAILTTRFSDATLRTSSISRLTMCSLKDRNGPSGERRADQAGDSAHRNELENDTIWFCCVKRVMTQSADAGPRFGYGCSRSLRALNWSMPSRPTTYQDWHACQSWKPEGSAYRNIGQLSGEIGRWTASMPASSIPRTGIVVGAIKSPRGYCDLVHIRGARWVVA
jgi:hypothetical protein